MRSLLLGLALALGASAATRSTSAAAATSTEKAGNQCYWIDGSVSLDSFRCDNSTAGHTTCCQAGAVCYSNGVCKVVNNNVQDWQRVGCTDPKWQDPSCLNQCKKYAPGSSAGIRPCDGIDKGTHYCCDPGPYIGSFACCNNSTNIFVMGTSIPTVLAQMPLSQLSTTLTSSTPASSASTRSAVTTTPAESSGSGSGSGSGTNTTAIGVGLGVGIPVAAVIAGAFWFFSRRANKARGGPGSAAYEPAVYSGSAPMGNMSTPSGGYAQPGYQQMSQHGGWGPGSSPNPGAYGNYNGTLYDQSGAAMAPNMPKYGGPPYASELGQHNAPVELPDRSTATELPAATPR